MSIVIYSVQIKIRNIFTNSMRKDILFKSLLYWQTPECQQNCWDCKQNPWDWRKNCMDWRAISNIPSSSMLWGMTHQIYTQFLLGDVLYKGDLRRHQGLAGLPVQTYHFFPTEKLIFPIVHFPSGKCTLTDSVCNPSDSAGTPGSAGTAKTWIEYLSALN